MQTSCLAAVSAINRPSKVQAGKKIYDNTSNLPDVSIPKQCPLSSSVTKGKHGPVHHTAPAKSNMSGQLERA